jgi:catechol 2,3-dioxygenase-like lactoylglutathione lyase family enzyme
MPSKEPVPLDDSSSFAKDSAALAPLSLSAKLQRKLIGTGVRGYFAAMRMVYRLRFPWDGKLQSLDHITIPCHDSQIAEEFYVGLLGAQIVNRIDRRLLKRIGWREEDIARNAAEHLSVTLGGGPRLDLFVYPPGSPSASAPMHPHIAITVAPRRFLTWKKRLEDRGVSVAGPTRPGPPGQASFYFNDPFGNHLEIITLGFVARDLPVGVPDRSQLNYRWLRPASTARS